MSEEKFVPDKLMCDADVKIDEDVKYRDVKEDPFRVYGLYNYKNEPVFKRLPDEIGLNVNPGVAQLYLNTAGGRVRFSTDSEYVVIRSYMSKIGHHNHMSLLGGAGFDLYEDDPVTGESTYVGSFRPPYDMTDGYVSLYRFRDGGRFRYLTINFPTYSNVDRLEIGLQETATLGEGLTYRNKKPFVFYGSSITQGGCASRPGNNYISLVCRRLNLDYINLGFSGSGKGEPAAAELLAAVENPAMFILDYAANAQNDGLRNTLSGFIDILRRKHPETPILMVSVTPWKTELEACECTPCRMEQTMLFLDELRRRREAGDENIHFLDGFSLYGADWTECTVDGVHATDLGFFMVAHKMAPVIAGILE